MHVVISPALSFQHHWRWFQCSMCRVIGARKLPWAGAHSWLKVAWIENQKEIESRYNGLPSYLFWHFFVGFRPSQLPPWARPSEWEDWLLQSLTRNLLATVIWRWAVSNHILHTEPRVSIDLSTHDLDMPARPSHHTGWQHFCQSSYKNSSRNSFVPPHSSNQIFFGTSSHLEL